MSPVPQARIVIVLALVFVGAWQRPVNSQTAINILGVRLSPGLGGIVKEIESRTSKRLYAAFEQQPEYRLGASFIDEDGLAVLVVDPALEDTPKKLEAVIAHELLHLRLTVNNYPSYIFSPAVQTAKGRALDVEQSNINDLRSLIEHRIFKADMERFGLYQFIDLAGDTAAQAKNKRGSEAGQNDVINYARAILEYPNSRDIENVRQIYQANGWKRALKDGTEIAAIINGSVINTPEQDQTAFLKCILKLYPPPSARFTFKLTLDPDNKHFRRMVISIGRVGTRR